MLRSSITGLLITAGVAVGAQTNQFHPFPECGAWRVDARALNTMGGGCTGERYYYHYVLGGDTVINAVTYQKVIRPGVELVNEDGGPPCYLWYFGAMTGYFGAIRQDPFVNKVFIVRPEQSSEVLLYDYNIAVGSVIYSSTCTILVESMDSVLIDGSYRWRWSYTDCYGDPGFIIAGVGQTTGFIEFMFWPAGNLTSHLICVQDCAITLFDSGVASPYACELITGIDHLSASSPDSQIGPNPCSDSFHLFVNDVGVLEIFDQQGRSVLRAADPLADVSTAELSEGAYIVRLHAGGSLLVSKLVVQR